MNEQLLEHLRREFGSDPVDFLMTAESILMTIDRSRPLKHPNSVGYLLRECLSRILLIGGAGRSNTVGWRKVSRAVVDAKTRFMQATGDTKQVALDDLVQRIDEMSEFHETDELYRHLLGTVILRRSGVDLATSAVVDRVATTFLQLRSQLNREGVHKTISVEMAEDLFGRTVDVLTTLFLPSGERLPLLDELAAIADPAPDDARRLAGLFASPHHQAYFFQRARSIKWLALMETIDPNLVAPPDAPSWWPVLGLLERQTGDKDGARDWLLRHAPVWSNDKAKAAQLAEAAAALELEQLLQITVGRHLEDPGVVFTAFRHMESMDARSTDFGKLAELILTSEGASVGSHLQEIVVERLVSNVDLTNWNQRFAIVARRLKKMDDVSNIQGLVLSERAGSLDEPVATFEDEHFSILLFGLLGVIRGSIQLAVSTAEILGAVSDLEGDLRTRVEAWYFANDLRILRGESLNFLVDAVASRSPCGDDIGLMQREPLDEQDLQMAMKFQVAFGPAPAGDIDDMILKRAVAEHVFRKREWAQLLPGLSVPSSWTPILEALARAYGPASSHRLSERRVVTADWGRSPYTVDELNEKNLDEVCSLVRTWRPKPTDFFRGTRELARTLQSSVTAQSDDWLLDPVMVVNKLRHPLYISHYFMGLTDQSVEQFPNAPAIVQSVNFCAEQPWQPENLGGNKTFDYDPDWGPTALAGVDLIKRLVSIGADLGEEHEAAWELVLRMARDQSEASNVSTSADDEYLTSALNRPCMRALDAVVELLLADLRNGKDGRDEAFKLLSDGLNLDDQTGLEHRAIIAWRLPALVRWAPAWTDQIRSQYLAPEAPADFIEKTWRVLLRTPGPHRWYLEGNASMILRLMTSGADRAEHAAALAMFWNIEGYHPESIVSGLLRSKSPSAVSGLGEALGRLMQAAEDLTEPQVNSALRVWRAANASGVAQVTPGFGWMAEAKQISEGDWRELTAGSLRLSGGRLDWSHRVAKRASLDPIDEGSLAILDEQIRGLSRAEDWEGPRVANIAAAVIRSCPPKLVSTASYERLRTSLSERGHPL